MKTTVKFATRESKVLTAAHKARYLHTAFSIRGSGIKKKEHIRIGNIAAEHSCD